MKRKLNWKSALAGMAMATAMAAPVTSDAQSTDYVNGYMNRSSNVLQRSTAPTWNSWSFYGYESRSWYDPRYGWIRADRAPDGSIQYYTFGYQIVLVWTNRGYVETTYPGAYNVAYPVVYGPRP